MRFSISITTLPYSFLMPEKVKQNSFFAVCQCIFVQYEYIVHSSHLPASVSIWPSMCFMLKISEKLEDKKTSGTNRLSKDLSSEYDDLWIGLGQVLRLFVRETYISSFPFLEIWIWPSTNHCEHVLFILCQKLQHASLSLLVVLTICYYALFCVEKAPVCLICNGCQGLREMCFQLPLGRMTDGKTIKHRTAVLCVSACLPVCACMHARVHPCVTMFVSVQACMCKLLCACLCVHACICVFMWSVLRFFPDPASIQHRWNSTETATTATDIMKYNNTELLQLLLVTTQIKETQEWCFELSLLSIKFPNDPRGSPPKSFVVQNQIRTRWRIWNPNPKQILCNEKLQASTGGLILEDCPHKTWTG